MELVRLPYAPQMALPIRGNGCRNMKILVFYIVTSTSSMTYHISNRYMLSEIIPKHVINANDTIVRIRLLDMEKGLLHEINTGKTERHVVPYLDPGKWEVTNKETTAIHYTMSPIIQGCSCEQLEITEQYNIPGIQTNPHKKVLTICDVPVVRQYIKQDKYLNFLHFYSPEYNRPPYLFVLDTQFHSETLSKVIETVSFKEIEVGPNFFTDFLKIPGTE